MTVKDKFLKTCRKEVGEDTATILSEREPVESVSTGSLAIDWVIGPYCPGFPLGRLSQVYGEESSGKSMLMCQTIAEAQEDGLDVFLIDRENHYSKEWFSRFGGDPEGVVDLDPSTVEEAFEQLKIAAEIMESEGSPGGIFVIDSLQSLPTEKQFQADMGTGEGLAGTARYLSANLSGIVKRIGSANLAVITVGQIRDDPNPYSSQGTYTPGGNALKHYSVLRLHLHYKNAIMEKDEDTGDEYRIGFTSLVKTEKNNVGGMPRGQGIEVEFFDYSGSDDTQSLFSIAKRIGLVKHKGAGYFYIPDLEDEDGNQVKFRGQGAWKEVCTGELKHRIEELAFNPESLKQIGSPLSKEE